MVEVARTFDPVRLTWLRAVLAEAGVPFAVFDAAASTAWPGAFPARLMVEPRHAWIARDALRAAGAEPPEP